MKNNYKHLSALSISFAFILFAFLGTSFAGKFFPQQTGSIEGYVLPRLAKPYVEIALPHPTHPNDTIHRRVQPNAGGYFKFTNVPQGSYVLVYRPENIRLYKSTSKMVDVAPAHTANAGSVRLEVQ